MVPMNLEIEDPLEDDYGPLKKRPKLFGQWGYGANALLEEPPLRLRLNCGQNPDPTAIITDKLKMSNFAASLLRIEKWEVTSIHTVRAASMSTSDLMNRLEDCISEHMTEEGSDCREMLEGIAEYLLGDTQLTPAFDERLVSRVDSLCRLLQEDPSVPSLRVRRVGRG